MSKPGTRPVHRKNHVLHEGRMVMDMSRENLQGLVAFCFETHDIAAKSPAKALRYWDMRTPYGIHPTWCAITILTETALDEQTRWDGAQALLLHDLLEDTTAQLPEGISPRVRALVNEMTFHGGLKEEQELVWSRSDLCLLLKLFDKVSTLLDAAWMKPEKRAAFVVYTLRLCDFVEWAFGTLNITRIARAICV